MQLLKEHGVDDVLVIVGGVIPPKIFRFWSRRGAKRCLPLGRPTQGWPPIYPHHVNGSGIVLTAPEPNKIAHLGVAVNDLDDAVESSTPTVGVSPLEAGKWSERGVGWRFCESARAGSSSWSP